MTRLVVLAAVVSVALAPAGPAQAAESVTETIWIPLPPGTERDVRLEATLFRPSSPGPHPVVVFNHGSTGAGRVSPKVTVRYATTANFFVERGMAVLTAMRRGRGASGGDYLERYDCNMAVLGRGVDRAIEDLDAVMAYVAQQPWADMSRIVLGGMSRGAFLSIVYASSRRTGARGVINFAGGWTVEHCDTRIGFHEHMLTHAGRAPALPMLWLYAENDRNYGPNAIRSYHRAFTRAGGTAELHVFPPIGSDGHILLPSHVEVWNAAVGGFLDRIGLGPAGSPARPAAAPDRP